MARWKDNPQLVTLAGDERIPATSPSGGAKVGGGSVAAGKDIFVTPEQLKDYAGGGGAGAPWFIQFKPYDNEPPASNYATLDLRNNRPTLDFDDTTNETAVFSGVLPAGYAGGGLTVTVFCSLTSATTGTVGWDVAFERTQASTDDIDSDSFAAAKTVTATTVPGTSGQVLALSVNVANGSEMDSLAAGELFRLRVRRDVANDTATGDAEMLAVSIKEQ